MFYVVSRFVPPKERTRQQQHRIHEHKTAALEVSVIFLDNLRFAFACVLEFRFGLLHYHPGAFPRKISQPTLWCSFIKCTEEGEEKNIPAHSGGGSSEPEKCEFVCYNEKHSVPGAKQPENQ